MRPDTGRWPQCYPVTPEPQYPTVEQSGNIRRFWCNMKRRLLTILIFLLAGAVLNVAVAWGCSYTATPEPLKRIAIAQVPQMSTSGRNARRVTFLSPSSLKLDGPSEASALVITFVL